MVKTLRSLCLLHVSGDGLHHEDLPPELLKDLKLMNIFNGNYIHELEAWDEDDPQLAAVTIQYDGVCWNFKSRSECFPHLYCCPMYNDTYQPPLLHLTVIEGQPALASSPFSTIRYWLDMVEEEPDQQMEMKMDVLVGEYGMSGRISFAGSSGAARMLSILEVDLSPEGGRVLSHSGEVFVPEWVAYWEKDRLLTHTVKLEESEVSAEDAYLDHGEYRELLPEGSEDEEEGDDGYEAVNVDELGGYAQDMTDKEADAEDDDWLTEFWQLMEEVYI